MLSGLSAGPNQDLVQRLGAQDRATAVVHHDLQQISAGVVLRTLRYGPHESLTTLELAHGCVSCTLREDLLPLLRRLAETPEVHRIVLHLDEAMEPEEVSWAIHNVLIDDRSLINDVAPAAVVTVFDADTWLTDATGDESMADRDLCASPDDERTVAQVTLAQVEFADVLVRAGQPSDPWTAAKTSAVLQRVAPTAATLELSAANCDTLLGAVPRSARRGLPDDPHACLLRGEPPLHTDCGVTVLLFTARRPFHPERLHTAIDVLLDGVVRTRGRVWIASQPDTALWVESAGGGLGVGHLGPWLDAKAGPSWDHVSAERSAFAALRWDPVFGDRAQELVILAHDADPEAITAHLNAALITDDELAAGHEAWARYRDPFGEWHEDPCADNALSDAEAAETSTVHNGRTEQ